MKYILSLIISGVLVVSGFGQTRNVLVGTNNSVVQPTNFWSADASNARSGLGLGTAATNPTSAFQPSSVNLSNIAVNNGGGLTNLSATSITGVVSVVQGGTGSTNASDARTALGLGTAATNSETVFQPSSVALSNLAISNGGALTNLQAGNLVGTIPSSNIPSVTFTNLSGTLTISQGGTGATNASDARANLGATTIGNSIFTATNAEAGRVVLGATTIGSSLFTLVNPSDIRFLRLNADNTATALVASDFRTAIGLGTAATNAETAFQPTSTNLTILAANNGSGLTNLAISNVVGLQTSLNTKLNTNGNGAGLTNLTAANISGAIAIVNGGTGATNAATARTNLGLGATWLTNTNSTNFRNDIGLGTLNNVQFAEVVAPSLGVGLGTNSYFIANSENVETALPIEFALNSAGGTRTNLGLGATWLTNTNVTNFRSAIGLGTNAQPVFDNLTILADLFAGSLEVAAGSNGTTVASDGIQFTGISAATTSTNLGLGATWLTNTNVANFRTAIGIGTTNTPVFAGVSFGGGDLKISNDAITWSGVIRYEPETQTFSGDVQVENGAISIAGTNAVLKTATTRTNLGLPWSGLTNTNSSTFQSALFGSNTNPVLVDTNGSVVSPTNFWQVAPISTTVQYQTNVTGTSTNAATNSRNLFLFSLASSVSGITNTVTLPTNPATTFEGDRATVTHLAQTTNAVTAIRQLGAATNIITLNQLDEAVLFMYRSGAWRLADNISYVEPIFFSGTNAAANAAASRTNLGLGQSSDVVFQTLNARMNAGSNPIIFNSAILFDDVASEDIVEKTRTNLGLGAASDVVFGSIDTERIEIQSGTNIYTYLGDDVNEFKVDSTFFNEVVMNTNLIVSGFVNFSTNHTNVAPATNNQIQKFLQIRIGTNAFFLPLYK
jgi:hypothetical protein